MRRSSTAVGEAEPGRAMPMASATDDMVLAVNIPAHDPAVGQAWCSMRESSSSDSDPAAWAPTASNTLTMSRVSSSGRPGMWPGRMVPP